MEGKITSRNKNFWLQASMTYWSDVHLPKWLVVMQYSAHEQALEGIVIGKSKLKEKQHENKSSWKVLTGGCTERSAKWPDPPQGPPLSDFRSTIALGIYNWAWLRAMRIDKGLNNERSTQSDRVETRSDIGGTGAVTDRHGCKHKYPDNRWGGPPR